MSRYRIALCQVEGCLPGLRHFHITSRDGLGDIALTLPSAFESAAQFRTFDLAGDEWEVGFDPAFGRHGRVFLIRGDERHGFGSWSRAAHFLKGLREAGRKPLVVAS